MLYKLKYGSHGDGKRHYDEGSLVESLLDLVALFPGKFEEVSRRSVAVQIEPPTRQDGISLEDLTTEELRMLAQEERIDIGDVVDRTELVRIVGVVLEG